MYVIFMFPLIRNVDRILQGNISISICKYDRIKILGLGISLALKIRIVGF